MPQLAHYVTDAVTASAFAFPPSRHDLGPTQAEAAQAGLDEVRHYLLATERILEASGRHDAADRVQALRGELGALRAELFDAIVRADDCHAEAERAERAAQ